MVSNLGGSMRESTVNIMPHDPTTRSTLTSVAGIETDMQAYLREVANLPRYHPAEGDLGTIPT